MIRLKPSESSIVNQNNAVSEWALTMAYLLSTDERSAGCVTVKVFLLVLVPLAMALATNSVLRLQVAVQMLDSFTNAAAITCQGCSLASLFPLQSGTNRETGVGCLC